MKNKIDYSAIANKDTNKIEISGLFYVNKNTGKKIKIISNNELINVIDSKKDKKC